MTGSVVVSLLLAVTAIAGTSLLAARLAARSRAAVRHLMLAATVAVLAMLPIAAALPLSIQVHVPEASPSTNFVTPAVDVINDFVSDPAPHVSAASTRVAASPTVTPANVAATLWVVGAIASLVPLLVGLIQIRVLRRSALPWREGGTLTKALAQSLGLRSSVDVLRHESVTGPMTSGVLRPVILLPVDADRWRADDLERALVHELEHVRRRDWIVHLAARVVCAAYWFHPLVWIVRSQLGLEAERACDDAVLARTEAVAYADQLVDFATRLSAERHQPLLAMARRRDLNTRVRALLDRRQARGRVDAVTVTAATVLAVGLAAMVSPFKVVARASGASMRQASASQKFEAVSIRQCTDDTPPPGAGSGQRSSQGGFPAISPGRFTIDCGTIERMISNAYVLNGERLENNSPRIGDVSWWKGGPEWIRYDKFSIEASAPGVSDRAVLLGPMLRALLEDRFKLKLHRETQDAPMYAMSIAKSGLKIEPIGPDGCEQADQVSSQAAARDHAAAVIAGTVKPNCSGMTMLGTGGHTRWVMGGTSLPGLAQTLTAWMDHFVLDRTDASTDTKYNITLDFALDEHVPGPDKRNPASNFAQPEAPNIFSALEQQVGVTLTATKGPQGVLVIDHIERPQADGGPVPARAQGPGAPQRR